MPCHAGWVGPTVPICIYGFFSMMRPIEPFMTEFLTGTYKNLTTEQVNRQVYPVWTYSSLVFLIPVLLVTDFLRYKPVIILQGLSHITAFVLLLVGSGVRSAQLAFFSYSIAMAADVAYFSYIYSVVQPSHYQRVTSYVKAAILLGYSVGALLGYIQLLWVYMEPGNFTAFNGAVDGISTLSGAAATVAVGHMSLEWSVWGELVLGGFTFLIAGALFLMDRTDNIWISYSCFFLFKTIYMQLSTICTFQIAKTLQRERYALSLKLTITSQFLIYASYFAAVSLLFTVRGVYTALHMQRPAGSSQTERDSNLPEASRL
ncbi:Thiamine transporter 1 [Dissostichus eleginoides]|uniref:Thiamine transporter 1 n=1 Tax=Dissostichus eleginoides TaxID=100907 RepID=A0AAD9FFJ2_DISEL|nr:Thiamine transporter 1 [Dissostichus eleginoides]